MTEARWKLVMDGQSLTIANDRFQFTTNGPALEMLSVESSQIEGIVSELQTMTKRTYGQYCGLARALEIVGERWVLLLVRDLLVSPKSGQELQRGLPRIPTELLCTRLSELERMGVVKRCPDDTAAFELTEWGRELEDIVLRLGRWGARLLGDPRPEDIVTADAVVTALRATFQPAAALDLYAGYELRLGDVVVHACVADGTVDVAAGDLPDADLVIEPGPHFKGLIAGELDPVEAVRSGRIVITGDPELLRRFVEAFYLADA